jgi:hypothetical protein
MKFIKITSKGEIDERAFSLLGASSKRDDSTKIGMFGSGLKYSLAFLLRNSIMFRVFSGYREVKFTTTAEDFRDKSFKRIYVNEVSTSLTTDMGMDWEHWFVLREIYCNALDESEGAISIEEYDSIQDINPVEDFTAFFIQVDDKFQEILDNWDLYFSNNRKDLLYHDTKLNQIYSGGDKSIVYRKGIRCHYDDETKSLFHYDMSWVKINESRTIASDWDFKWTLCKFLKEIKDESIIHRILYNINNFLERSMNWERSGDWSDAWLNEIGEKYLIPTENAGFWEEELKTTLKGNHIILPSSMVDSLKLFFGDKVKIIGDDSVGGGRGDMKILNEIGKREQYLLDTALAFLKDAGYDVKYPIKVVKFHKKDMLGLAKDDTIFISEKAFTMGQREVVSVIMEESEHNKTGYFDETRQFQNHLFNMVIAGFEEKTGKYL